MKCARCKEAGVETDLVRHADNGECSYVTALWVCPVEQCGHEVAEL